MTDPVQQIKGALKSIGVDQFGNDSATMQQWDMWDAACNPAAIRILIARLEAAEKDAERYRWLIKANADWGICEWDRKEYEWVRDSRGATVVAAAIDAAMECKK